MQTKSWQIASLGLLPLAISNITFIYSLISAPCQEPDCTLSLFLPLMMLGFLDSFAALIVLFLRSEKRRNIGIALSLASGFFISGLYAVYGTNIGTVPTVILVLWPVLFLSAAGVYGIVKKA